MTKNKFLHELKKGLNILNDEERKEIINEYSDIIDEKLKSGLTFKEVLADFGDINELIVEILKAYKINPNYKKRYRSDGFTFFEGIEFAIKNISSKLANKIKLKAEDIKDNKNFTLEKILEALIKFIILMVALALLKLPFYFLYLLGSNIIYFGHNCISNLFLFVWKLSVFIFYLITCFLIIFLFFYNQFKIIKKDNLNKEESSKKKINKSYNKLIFLKSIVFLVFLLPLTLINISLFLVLGLVIYLIFKGIAIYGLLILVIGLLFVFSSIYRFCSNLFSFKSPFNYFSILVGVMLMIVGALFTVDYVSSIKVHNSLPKVNFSKNIYQIKESFKGELLIDNVNKIEINNELVNNEIVITVNYYDKYIIFEKDLSYNKNIDQTILRFDVYKMRGFKSIFNDIISRLKENELYNYRDLYNLEIKIEANEKTLEKINKKT